MLSFYICAVCGILFVLGSLLFQLGVECPWRGGLLTLSRFSASSLSLCRRSSVVWLLMPCVLLVWQIPYRVMSLGLKVVILRWSCLARCSWCRVAWARRDSQLVRIVLDLTGGSLDVTCYVRPGSPLSDGLLSSICALCLECRGTW